MKIKIVRNKYLNTLLLLILFSAIAHIIILFYIVVQTGDFYTLNYFNVLDITYFVPNFSNSLWGNIISVVFLVFIYFVILLVNKIK